MPEMTYLRPLLSSSTIRKKAPPQMATSATLKALPVEVEKVDDVAVDGAVDHVPERTCRDEREREAQQLAVAVAHEKHDHRDDDGGGEGRERPALPAARIGQERKGRARVVRQDQIESRAHGQDLAEREVLLEPDLRRLINAEDEESEAEPGGELRGGRAGGGVRHEGFLRPPHQAKRRFSPAPKRLDAQRGQSVGCSASLPMPAT